MLCLLYCLLVWTVSRFNHNQSDLSSDAIIAPSLPKISQELNSFNLYSWVAVAYLLSSTAISPSYGRFSDIFGRRAVYMFCVIVFLVGSALCGASTTMIMLIISRAIQGIGGGGIINLTFIIMGGNWDFIDPKSLSRSSLLWEILTNE